MEKLFNFAFYRNVYLSRSISFLFRLSQNNQPSRFPFLKYSFTVHFMVFRKYIWVFFINTQCTYLRILNVLT